VCVCVCVCVCACDKYSSLLFSPTDTTFVRLDPLNPIVSGDGELIKLLSTENMVISLFLFCFPQKHGCMYGSDYYLSLYNIAKTYCDEYSWTLSLFTWTNSGGEDQNFESWTTSVSVVVQYVCVEVSLRCPAPLIYISSLSSFTFRDGCFGIYTLRQKPGSQPSWQIASVCFHVLNE